MTVLQRAIFGLLVCVSLATYPALADSKGENAEKFVAKLGETALSMVTNKDLVGDARREEFRKLLQANFDMAWIGQFVLGKHWRRASPDQRETYLKLFEESVVFTYTNQFDEYSGQTFEVTGNTEADRFTMVKSKIVDPANPESSVLVDWRLIEDNGNFKIVDVVIEGISMGITQRNEYSAVIDSNGGKIDSLLVKMEEILENLRKRA
ncbi:MAG: ABC transporter substrate-binding protein [Nisaea sp.]|jgi:phospholipid transport system substrate-binding protein|uniref:MlaC/ttg2D family ABC transporter substrate-binding protein n=1 Tax=Nisaea sp. TaxID=2024842 RepID=UPI001B2D2694|nr:ABC transporter substrate-binding protein [Nisaea sp.]MBO6562021.1 ABC transporter substrate-binding protein [Nisaea sp.]